MMTHEQKTRLGVFLALATVIFLVVAAFFLVPKLSDPGESYVIKFRDTSVNGLSVGGDVKYRGVLVGRVTAIGLSPTDPDCVHVTVKIRPGLTVRADMQAQMVYVGITGQKFVELSGGSPAAPKVEAHGEIPMSRGLGEKADDIVNNLQVTAKRITEVLSPENVAKFTAFMDSAEKGSAAVAGLLQDRRGSLDRTLASVETATADMAAAMASFKPLAENLNRLVGAVETGSKETLDNISRRFSAEELGGAIADLRGFLSTASVSLKKIESVLLEQQNQLQRTFASLGEAVENLARFSREIAEEPSALVRTRKDKK